MSRAWLVPLLLLLGSPGCAYKVRLLTVPAGAEVRLPNGTSVVTPAEEIQLRWAPFNRQPVTVLAAGYRPMTIDLRKHEIRFGHYIRDTLLRPATLLGQTRGTVNLVLVPIHEHVGTWDAADVP